MNLKYIKKPIIRNPIVILSTIITIGIAIRIIFAPFEIPMNSDNFAYFMYAIDHSLGQNSTMQVYNNGWSFFVSFFFSLYNSDNFLDYMALQRILSVIISSLTAIPIYFLCRKFFDEKFALLGSLIFVFEPRIIQNSTFGIADPLYILLIVIGIVLVLNFGHKKNYLAFTAIALASTVRIEGLLLLPAFIFVFFLKNKINREKIFHISISVLIFILIISAVGILRTNESGSDGFLSRVNDSTKDLTDSPETKMYGSTINLVSTGLLNMFKFIGWSQIPMLIFVVPIGFVLMIKDRKIIKFVLGMSFFILLPAVYAFSFASDTRYLFPLYPIFVLMSLFLFKWIYEKKNKFFKISQISLIVLILISSPLFLIWKDVDRNYESEVYEIIKEMIPSNIVVNNFLPESSYIFPAGINQMSDFPKTWAEMSVNTSKIVDIRGINSMEELLVQESGYIKNRFDTSVFVEKITHIVVKENNDPVFLNDIFENEEKYDYLIKEYDSKEKGHDIHFKLFRINYDEVKISNLEQQ